MYGSLPSFVLGFHGCDKSIGLDILNGKIELNSSSNPWDWLGTGMYFWEHDAALALEYAKNVATGDQFAKGKINTPFVIGAIIDLRNCWNLPTTGGIQLLRKGYQKLMKTSELTGVQLPKNISEAARYLDRAVFEYIHTLNLEQDYKQFDSVRGAFPEGKPVYKGTSITAQNHIQICIRSKACIRGYFLPRPTARYNPNL